MRGRIGDRCLDHVAATPRGQGAMGRERHPWPTPEYQTATTISGRYRDDALLLGIRRGIHQLPSLMRLGGTRAEVGKFRLPKGIDIDELQALLQA